MNAEQVKFGMLNGYSPIADRVLLIDYDGTLFPFDELYSQKPPLPGAAEAMRELKRMGFVLRIFSSRLANSWLDAADESLHSQLDHMGAMLSKYHIPYDGFAFQKDPAQFYIDDRAIEFRNNWSEIVQRLAKHALGGEE